jgi:hypothetical protein
MKLLNTLIIDDEGPIHFGTYCRNCGMKTIRGICFRCGNCIDYDLCELCEKEGIHNPEHIFIMIKKNLPLMPKTPKFEDVLSEPLLSILCTPNNVVAKCSNCDQNIQGNIYKCSNCKHWELCYNCIDVVHHLPYHLYLKIKYPLTDKLEEPLIPIVLHGALYPQGTNNVQVPDQSIIKECISSTFHSGTYTKSIWSLRGSVANISESSIVQQPNEQRFYYYLLTFYQKPNIQVLFPQLQFL